MSPIAWTSPRTWVAAETVTAALLNTHIRDNLIFINARVLGYAQAVANQGSITTEADLTSLTVTLTPGTSRRIRITADVYPSSTVATDHVAVYIKEGATYLTQRAIPISRATSAHMLHAEVILTPTSASHTYKLALERTAGSGTVTNNAAATFPSFLLVEDIGV